MRRKLFKILVCLCALIIGTSATFAQDGQSKAIALCHEADSILDAVLRGVKYKDLSVSPQLVKNGFELNAQALAQPGIDFDLYQTIMEHRRYYCSEFSEQHTVCDGSAFRENEQNVGNYNYIKVPANKADEYISLFKAKAEAGDTYAMISLANLYVRFATYERREVTVPNPKKPGKTKKEKVTDWFAPNGEFAAERYMYWMKKAIELGNRTAMYVLGIEYVGTEPGNYVRKHSLNYIPAQMISNNPVFSEATFANGINLLEQASDKGNFDATKLLVTLYDSTDQEKSGRYFLDGVKLAYKNGYYSYLIYVANAYFDRNNYEAAKSYYEAVVAKTNSKYAISRIGDLYLNGAGVQQDIDKAIELYIKADNYSSIVQQADEYNTQQDYNSAKRLYEIAATNSKYAMNRLGDLYFNGTGVKQDINTAKEWYKKAGNDDAIRSCDDILYGKYINLPFSIEKVYGTFYWKNNNLVNKSGKIIIPANKYDKVLFDSDVIIVKKKGKYGAVTYKGTQIVAPIYDTYSGHGSKEGRLLFANDSKNGGKCFVFSLKGQLLTSRAFTYSQKYTMLNWMKEWLGYYYEPLYEQ